MSVSVNGWFHTFANSINFNVPLMKLLIILLGLTVGFLYFACIWSDKDGIKQKLSDVFAVGWIISMGAMLIAFVISIGLSNPKSDAEETINPNNLANVSLVSARGTGASTPAKNATYYVKVNDSDVRLIKVTYGAYNHIKLDPVNATGKAYLMVNKFYNDHRIKQNATDIKLLVQMDKSTLTYSDANGRHIVICRAKEPDKLINKLVK